MTTRHETINIGVAEQIGPYSDAALVSPGLQWLFTAGTPGLQGDRNLPKDITGQCEKAWENILIVLQKAGMDVGDIVKVTTYLTDTEDIQAYAAVRKRFLGDTRPVFMLLVTPALVWPDIRVEIEVIAAKKI